MAKLMTYDEVIHQIRFEIDDAEEGYTLDRAPQDDVRRWCRVTERKSPLQYEMTGPRGGTYFIGVATHVGRRTISFGQKDPPPARLKPRRHPQ